MSKQFVIYRENDENLTVFLGNVEIGHANHDVDGWQGMSMLEQTVRAIATELGIEVIEDDSHTDH